MSGYLLDTNVISELTRPSPEPGVVSFLTGQNDLWLSAIVIHELDFGLNLLPEGRLRERLRDTLEAIVEEYEERILPLGRAEAEWAGQLRAQSHRRGRVLGLGDALIAGTAAAQDLAIVTRNVRDFDGLGLDVLDPWHQI